MHELERRVRQRFSLRLPLVLEGSPAGAESRGLTRDVSAVGVFFYTDAAWLRLSAPIAFSMILPIKITGTKGARVRCQGTIVRLETGVQSGTGVAATIDSYDF
jgi:PilZ domain